MSLRRRVAIEAARILYHREIREYLPAKQQAAKTFGTHELPTNAEVQDELLLLSQRLEGQGYAQRLGELRRIAVDWMERLADFEPLLLGSVLTGHIRPGSDVDLHVFSDDLDELLARVPQPYTVERVDGWVHVRAGIVEMTVHPRNHRHKQPRCTILGEPMRRAGLAEVRELPLLQASPLPLTRAELEAELGALPDRVWSEVLAAYLTEEIETREEGLSLAAELL